MDDRNHGKVGAPFGNQNRAGKRKKFRGKGRKKKEAFNLRKSEYLAKRRREALKSTDLTINTNVAAANPTPLNLQLESPVRQPMFEGQPHERQLITLSSGSSAKKTLDPSVRLLNPGKFGLKTKLVRLIQATSCRRIQTNIVSLCLESI